MEKARIPGKDEKVASLGSRIGHVEAFVTARKLIKTDPESAVKTCFQLLDTLEVENALRVGDVYALMVEWFYSQSEMEQAYQLIQKMVGRSIVLAPYLDQEMVSVICASMGVPVPQDPAPAAPAAPTDADEVEDQIEEVKQRAHTIALSILDSSSRLAMPMSAVVSSRSRSHVQSRVSSCALPLAGF